MTYERYREIVVSQVAEATGWSIAESDNTVGDIHDMMDEEDLTPDEAAREILLVICEDAEPL